ncbi:MAG: Hpt domain-containing protein [Pirellulales bacterium]|nr:Hpt domain-containing protein [Pirellulales bacterium]
MAGNSSKTTPSLTNGPPKNITSTDLGVRDDELLDLDGTLHRLGGDHQLLASLAKVFAEDSPLLLNRLFSAVQSMRGEEICKAAHALRGLAANFGAPSLTLSLRQLEEIGLRNDTARAQTLFDEVRSKTTALQALLDRHG